MSWVLILRAGQKLITSFRTFNIFIAILWSRYHNIININTVQKLGMFLGCLAYICVVLKFLMIRFVIFQIGLVSWKHGFVVVSQEATTMSHIRDLVCILCPPYTNTTPLHLILQLKNQSQNRHYIRGLRQCTETTGMFWFRSTWLPQQVGLEASITWLQGKWLNECHYSDLNLNLIVH